ncbi:NepR family anti-sigma factor [Oceaniglobus trochenteri]|nr:NepR family anti-sigma factor [Oceaniglobus trochenteri]
MKQIDENLRRVYRETEPEAVPDRFRQLLDKLRDQEKPNEQ